MIYFFLILSILVWPFGQLLTFSLPLPYPIYFLDLSVLLLALSLLFSPTRWKNVLTTPLFKPWLIFVGFATLSLLINYRQAIDRGLAYSVFHLLRLLIYPTVYLAAQQFTFNKLSRYLIVSFTIFCLFGIIQYLFFPDMRYLKNLGFDDHYFRLIGSFFDPNFTGAILAASSLFIFESGGIIVSLFLLVMLALTFSRASYFGYLSGVMYLLFVRRHKILIYCIFGLTILLYIIPKPFGEGVNLFRTFSIFSRIESWREGFVIFLQKPIFGWGYNTLRGISGSRFQIDNSYIYVAATTGILGLVAFLNFLRQAIINSANISQKVFLLVILTHSIFNNSFFYIWILFSVFLLLALPVRESKSRK